jgi:hypothetical protein
VPIFGPYHGLLAHRSQRIPQEVLISVAGSVLLPLSFNFVVLLTVAVTSIPAHVKLDKAIDLNCKTECAAIVVCI